MQEGSRTTRSVALIALLAIGAVIVAGVATFVVWQQFRHPAAELDGTWQGVRWEEPDGTSNNATASTLRWTIVGEKLKHRVVIYGRSTQVPINVDGFITTDRTQNPKTFDAGGAEGNATFSWSGIYELEGDTLKLCFIPDKAERPTEFKSNPAMLIVLKRLKQ